jgi:hypothetical protein
MLFVQSVLGGVVLIGWTQRLAQRAALRFWRDRSNTGPDWPAFIASDTATAGREYRPNWFTLPNWRQVWRDSRRESFGLKLRSRWRALTGSLWLNLKLGLQGLLNTWVLTLPAGILWTFAWYDGWNNSFNKGYEHAWIGPSIGALGIVLFIAAMFYVPMAQARQAVSGDWRRFYDFRLVRDLVKRSWLPCAGLALLYAVAALPFMVLAALPMFLPQINPALEQATPEEARKLLGSIFFWWALWVFPAFVLLRWLAARIYAAAVLNSVQRGLVTEETLSDFEWRALHRLGLIQPQPPRITPRWVRVAAWAGSRFGRLSVGMVTVLLWFAFVAQIYIAQFLNFRGALAWLNQPLVQLPWIHHLPGSAGNPWGQVGGAALLVIVGLLLRGVVRRLAPLRGKFWRAE